MTVTVRSRWDDCDRYGHVNNAAYLALVRAAHERAGLPVGELRAIEIVYRQPVPPEVVVDVEVDVVEQGDAHRRIAYALAVGGRSAADVTATWQLGGSPVQAELLAIDRDAGGRPFRFGQNVRSHELGPDGIARPQAILQWLEHAVFRAATCGGATGMRGQGPRTRSIACSPGPRSPASSPRNTNRFTHRFTPASQRCLRFER